MKSIPFGPTLSTEDYRNNHKSQKFLKVRTSICIVSLSGVCYRVKGTFDIFIVLVRNN